MTKNKILATLLCALILAVTFMSGTWYHKFNKDWQQQYAYAKGVDALIYTFPYFLNSALLYKWSQPSIGETNTEGPRLAANSFWHATQMANPKHYQDGGMPNIDTLYSVAWAHVKDEPLIISVPKIPDERYYTFGISGFDSDNFAYIGKRTHGNQGGHYAITPQGWQGELPDNVENLAQSPTPWFIIVGRTMLDPNQPGDFEAVSIIRSQYKITGLADWLAGRESKPEHPSIADVGPLSRSLHEGNIVDFIKEMAVSNPMLYWQIVNQAMTLNGIPARDQSRLADWADLHIGPGQDSSQLNQSEREGLSQAVLDGVQIMRALTDHGNKQVNGWVFPHHSLGRAGHKGHYFSRAALQSMKGIVAHDAEEAIYLPVSLDEHGEPLNGAGRYQLHFAANQLPKVKEFWSLTAYNEDGNLILNEIDRYSVNDRSKHLVYGDDGSLTIYLSSTRPQGKTHNWLPIDDAMSPTTLVLRAYGPSSKMIEQRWNPPLIKRLD